MTAFTLNVVSQIKKSVFNQLLDYKANFNYNEEGKFTLYNLKVFFTLQDDEHYYFTLAPGKIMKIAKLNVIDFTFSW